MAEERVIEQHDRNTGTKGLDKMKIFNVAAFPIASVLALTGGLLVTRDVSRIETQTQDFQLTTSWGSQSFDEAVWLAVDEIAGIEENLPVEVDKFQVRVESSYEDIPPIYIQFDRASLIRLKAGEITPENFMRAHVTFS